MEQEHLIIVAILALVLYMLMKHSANCDCKDCKVNKAQHIRYEEPKGFMPEHIRMREGFQGDIYKGAGGLGHIRYSDKYIGAGQHIKQHIRYDNKHDMLNGMITGCGQHIRY